MNEVKLEVNKINVYDEVAKTTSYQAVKKVDDAAAYDRIFTTDDDRNMLERFWVESCATASDLFKPFITSVDSQPESHGVDLTKDYKVTLELSSSFDTNLTDSVQTSLFSFFVSNIAAKWNGFADKDEAKENGEEALAHLLDIKSKIYFRKKPVRTPIVHTTTE